MSGKHELELESGEILEFTTKEELLDFSTKLTISKLVERGFGEIVTIDGEEGFKINAKGLAYLREQEGAKPH